MIINLLSIFHSKLVAIWKPQAPIHFSCCLPASATAFLILQSWLAMAKAIFAHFPIQHFLNLHNPQIHRFGKGICPVNRGTHNPITLIQQFNKLCHQRRTDKQPPDAPYWLSRIYHPVITLEKSLLLSASWGVISTNFPLQHNPPALPRYSPTARQLSHWPAACHTPGSSAGRLGNTHSSGSTLLPQQEYKPAPHPEPHCCMCHGPPSGFCNVAITLHSFFVPWKKERSLWFWQTAAVVKHSKYSIAGFPLPPPSVYLFVS